MTELSQKFDFLLHPIKDLTKNWNVDIAAVLEDFHEELEKMTFSFDGGKTQLNFAEAAFLIQGTACVWSRKVESLHNLVYQTLEMIMNNRHNKQPTSIDPQGVDADATFDKHEDKLLNLDDVGNANNKKLTTGGENVISMSLPCPFLQRSESNRGSPFLNSKGEVINYYHDFWSNNVVPQKQGSVLLECRVDEDMSNAAAQKLFSHEKSWNEGGCERSVRDDPADDFLEDMDVPDDHSIGAEATFAKPNITAVPQIEEFHRSLRPRNRDAATTKTLPETPNPRNEPLDPHSEYSEWDPKPFKKGKTVRLPASLQSNPKKRKATPPVTFVSPISDFLNAVKKSSAEITDWLKKEKIRRNELWKKLVPNTVHRRTIPCGVEQEHGEDDHSEIEDVIDNLDDHDMSNVDDLINDITSGGPQDQLDDAPMFIPDHDLDSYEDLVRHHVELFYSSAKRYVQESALSQRVRDWQDTIDPFLVEQDNHPEFDIHKYGDDVINHVSTIGDKKLFQDCIEGKTWQICRHFAATLQLANDGNVQLSTKCENNQNFINSLQVKLLSRHRPQDKIADYVPI